MSVKKKKLKELKEKKKDLSLSYKKEDMNINDTVQCLNNILPLDEYQAHTCPRSFFCECPCPFQDAETQE